MKRIIDIPDNVVKAIQNGEDYRYDIHTAIAQSKPYNPSGDCISRSDLRKEVVGMMINKADDLEEVEFEINATLASVCEAIDNAPPVEPRPKGEWIDYDNTFYKCPDCGYLLEKCCPQCQNKVILPKGGAE